MSFPHGVDKIRLSLALAKFPLCLLVAFSSFFGHVFAAQEINHLSLLVFVAVLLLACGGASLNSYQERSVDALLARTAKRPMVRRILSQRHAMTQAFLLMGAGLCLLTVYGDIRALLAGLAGLVLYNVVYTPLKRHTLYAIVPGAVCGAMPPYIGWLAAGGDAYSYSAGLLILLLVFWQVPHFFLVLLCYKDEYLKSIFPNILIRLSEPALKRIFLPWITALAATMITFSVIPTKLGTGERLLVVGNGVFLFTVFFQQLFLAGTPNYRLLFRLLGTALFLHMLVICLGVS